MRTNDKSLKILHWPTSYPDPSRGKPYDCIFVQEHIRSVASFCANRILYTPAASPANGKVMEFQRSLEHEILTDRIYFKIFRPLWLTNLYVRIILLIYLVKIVLLEKFYPDVLHVHFHQAGRIAVLFCKLFRIKMVVTEHWSAFVGWPELPNVRFHKAAKVFQYASWVFTVSNELKKGIEERCQINLSGKTSITLNAVDTNIFFYDGKYGGSKNVQPKKILAIARLAIEKDLPVLFQALKALEKKRHLFVCEIIGAGDPGQYKTQLSTLGISRKVIFLGPKPKQEIASKMRTTDVLAISSFIENSPCIIGEALCCGLPVVSTDVGGIPELLNESNGVLVPSKDPEKLAFALEEVLYHKEFDKRAISEKAIARFSYEAIGKHIFDTYHIITNSNS